VSQETSEKPVGQNAHTGSSGEVVEAALTGGEPGEGALPGGPKVTFRGNTYDLMSLGALISGALIFFSCLTCNMGYYCLPVIAVALGAVGVLAAHESVESKRTRLWSWLGIASGGIVLLLTIAFIVLYVGFMVVLAFAGEFG
jgi:hypothetical protein